MSGWTEYALYRSCLTGHYPHVSVRSRHSSIALFSVFGCLVAEENREAGENPARSRHCNEIFSESGDLPKHLSLLTLAQGVSGSFGSRPLSRSSLFSLPKQEQIRAIRQKKVL
jgi:hypothetical protein